MRRDTPSLAADSSLVHPCSVRHFNKRLANSSRLERAPLISLLRAFIAATAGQEAFRAVGNRGRRLEFLNQRLMQAPPTIAFPRERCRQFSYSPLPTA